MQSHMKQIYLERAASGELPREQQKEQDRAETKGEGRREGGRERVREDPLRAAALVSSNH